MNAKAGKNSMEKKKEKNGRTKGNFGELVDDKDSLKELLTVTRITDYPSISVVSSFPRNKIKTIFPSLSCSPLWPYD